MIPVTVCLATIGVALLLLLLNYILHYTAQRKVNSILLKRVELLEKAVRSQGIEVETLTETLPASANVEPRLVH